MKDLETKVDELQQSSDAANQENGLLRAQVERLRVELREYRKRLSLMASGSGSGSGLSAMSSVPGVHTRGVYGLNNNEFIFDFPKFGESSAPKSFANGQASQPDKQNRARLDSAPGSRDNMNSAPGRSGADALGGAPGQRQTSLNLSPGNMGMPSYQGDASRASSSKNSGLGAVKHPGSTNNFPTSADSARSKRQSQKASTKDTSDSNSPSTSSDSHQSQLFSSSRTSPEPDSNSLSGAKSNDAHLGASCGSIDGERSFCEQLGLACGNVKNPIPPIRENSSTNSHAAGQPAASTELTPGLDWFAEQNGGQFDPVLFGDWREPQDAILSQDFGNFFNDVFALPELDNEPETEQPRKNDLIAQIDKKLDADDEVVPGEDKSKLWTCTKIWYEQQYLPSLRKIRLAMLTFSRDRLQSMEKFRNGEIDVDSLCSELRTKAQCSEGGVVVNQKDVDCIIDRVGTDNEK